MDTAMKYPNKCAHVAWRIVDEEAVVVDPAQGTATVLNGSAGEIWQRLDGKTSVADIARQISEVFDVEQLQLNNDIDELLQKLTERKLVEWNELPIS